jgi:hypothetical protein
MDIDAIMEKDPTSLTDEELAFLERALLETTREFAEEAKRLCAQVGEKEPDLTARLERTAASLLQNVESAVLGSRRAADC